MIPEYKLVITWLVKGKRIYTFDDILKIPVISIYAILEMVSNPPVSRLKDNAIWTGIPLSYVLAQVGQKSTAFEVVFKCTDGYSMSIAIDKAMDWGVIPAYRVNVEFL